MDNGGTAPRAALAAPLRTIFASAGHEPRRRRADDAILLVLAGIIVLVAALVAAGEPVREADVAAAIHELLGWLEPLWRLGYGAASVLVVGLIAAAAIGGRRPLLRDLAFSGLLAVGSGAVLAKVIEGSWPDLRELSWQTGEPAYPALRIAMVAAVALVAAPDLTRPVRRLTSIVVGLVAVATVVVGAAGPTDVIGGFALGLAAGSVIRLVFGSAAGFPSEDRVRVALSNLGVDVTGLRRSDHQPEDAALYLATSAGRPVEVAVYGRDARDARLLSRLWRGLWYRDAGPQTSYTRLQQVEHEALLLLTAGVAGVPVPTVVAVGYAGTGDAVIVTTDTTGPTLASLDAQQLTDAILEQVWSVATTLRKHRIGHGRLNLESFRLVDGRVVLCRLGTGRTAASGPVLATDLAELLVSSAVTVGEDRTIGAAERVLGRAGFADALPYLQRAALTPAVREASRRAHLDLDGMRDRAAAAIGAELADVAEVRRVSLANIGMYVLILVAVYVLLSQLADVGLETIIDTFADAEWAWAVVALLIAQLPLVTDAFATQAAVGVPLPLGPTILVQSAVKFIALCVPSAAGRIALTVRYMHLQGVGAAVATTQGVLDSVAGFVVQVVVLLLVLPGLDLDIDVSFEDASGLVQAGIVLLVLGFLGAVIGVFIPKVRKLVAPYARQGLETLRSLLASPKRTAQLFAANVASQVLYALVLVASVRAFGTDISLAEALFVCTASSLLSGVAPVPGGIGVAEAALTGGLVIVGVPEEIGLAAALLDRMVTYYLPPIWGYVSMRWLRSHGYI